MNPKELAEGSWPNAFHEAVFHSYGYEFDPENPGVVDSAIPGDDIDVTGFSPADVVHIEAMAEGENDGDSWLICGQLMDGRWFALRAGCDYTGWDCQAGGSAQVARTRNEIIIYALTDAERERLGLVSALDVATRLLHGLAGPGDVEHSQE